MKVKVYRTGEQFSIRYWLLVFFGFGLSVFVTIPVYPGSKAMILTQKFHFSRNFSFCDSQIEAKRKRTKGYEIP